MTEDDPERDVAALHDHLVATRNLPVERAASRWIGEADAVVTDIVDADLSSDTVRERIGHVQSLLENVDGTGHPEADEHVDRARRIAATLLERPDDK